MAKNITNLLTWIILPLILGVAAPVLSGCADDPSPVGSFLLPRGDLVSVDSVIIIAGKSSGEKAAPFSFTALRSTFALGKSEGFEAWAFLRFLGFPDSLSNATLQSAEIRLQTLYHVGDSLGSVSLSVHRALGEWNRDSFVFDSLTPGIYDLSGSNLNLGSFGDNESVLFPLDTAFVREWVRSVSDTSFKNFGVILEPTNSTVIKGFHSGTSDSVAQRPTLTIRYIMSGSAQVDTLVLSSVLDKFVAGMSDATFLSDSTLVPARGGAAYRGVIGFDVSPVPAHAAVHRAFLDLTLDNISSRRASNRPDSLLALYGGVLNPIQIGAPISQTGGPVYRFNVTEFVQAMVRGIGDSNIRLSVFDEENTVGLFMIHGSAAADPAVRPKLTVLYSPTR